MFDLLNFDADVALQNYYTILSNGMDKHFDYVCINLNSK